MRTQHVKDSYKDSYNRLKTEEMHNLPKDPYSDPGYKRTRYEQSHEDTKRKETLKKQKQQPQVVEYGMSQITDIKILMTDEGMKIAMAALLDTFFTERKNSFPGWPGMPQIQHTKNYPGTTIELAWYAAVPIEYCGDWNKDEELWNS